MQKTSSTHKDRNLLHFFHVHSCCILGFSLLKPAADLSLSTSQISAMGSWFKAAEGFFESVDKTAKTVSHVRGRSSGDGPEREGKGLRRFQLVARTLLCTKRLQLDSLAGDLETNLSQSVSRLSGSEQVLLDFSAFWSRSYADTVAIRTRA